MLVRGRSTYIKLGCIEHSQYSIVFIA